MPQIIDDKLLIKRLFRDIQKHSPRNFNVSHYIEEGENAVRRLIPKFSNFDALGVALNSISEEEYLHNVASNGIDTLIVAYKAIEHFGASAHIKDTVFVALDPILDQLKLRLGPKYEEELLAEQKEKDAILAEAKESFASHGVVYYLKADIVKGDYPFLDKAGLPWLFTEEEYAVNAMSKADCFKCSVASFPASELTKKMNELVNMGIKMARLNPHTFDKNISFNCRDLATVEHPHYAAPVARSVIACLCLSEGRSADHLINYGGEVMSNLRTAASAHMLLVPFVPKDKGDYPTGKLYYTPSAKVVPGAPSAASLGIPGGEKLSVAEKALNKGSYDFLVTENRAYCYISAFTNIDDIYAECGNDINVGLFTFSELFEFVTLDKKVKGADGVAIFAGENRLMLSASESASIAKTVTVNAYQDYTEMQRLHNQTKVQWKDAFPPQRFVPAVTVSDGIVNFFTKFFSLKGRSAKKELTAGYIMSYVLTALLVLMAVMNSSLSFVAGVGAGILAVGLFTCLVRRGHDMGKSGASNVVLSVVSVLIFVGFFLFFRSSDKDNAFGVRRDIDHWEVK